ncbi:heat stress transcription factor A-2e isoform X1 [Aegilops tauschii subsp. strangulata]|uniref:heat stress transcription factor A-2e isoform X1 n=1 Tax=Aegilops tauschii subsp. strangulata TaxID=200361 RepID=UPI003CC8DAE6
MSHRMMSPVKVEGRPCPSPAAGGGGAPRPMDGLGDTGPTPFLAKTYDMVDDPAMDAVISWSATNRSSSGPPPLRHRAIAEVLRSLLSHATSLVGQNLALIRKLFRLLALVSMPNI